MSNYDIVGGRSDLEWIVCGWFTPDYRERAEMLAQGLTMHGAPFHLFAVSKHWTGGTETDWQGEVRRKPLMLRHAMTTYPAKTIAFMDVDCIVKGPIDDIEDMMGDVSFQLYVKGNTRKHRINAYTSSRVVMVRPNGAARFFVDHWIDACSEGASDGHGDESYQVVALSRAIGVRWSQIDPRMAAVEVTNPQEGVLIAHNSVHDNSSALERTKRAVKRWRRGVVGATTKVLSPVPRV